MFGLNSDPEFVSRTFQAGGSVVQGSDSPLHIPLTADELLEMHRRDAVEKAHGAVLGLGEMSYSDYYAGDWFDQKSGGVEVVMTTDPSHFGAGQVSSLLPPGSTVRYEKARFALKELNRVQAALMDDSKPGTLFPEYVKVTSQNLPNNRVDVRLVDGAPVDAGEKVQVRYGPALRISNDPQYDVGFQVGRGTQDYPGGRAGLLFGGHQIVRDQGSGRDYFKCTASTSAVGGGYAWTLSAGHCDPANTYFYEGDLLGTSLGRGYDNGFFTPDRSYHQSSCDCLAVGGIPGSIATDGVFVANNSIYHYGNLPVSQTNYQVGQPVYYSGSQTGISPMGTMTATDTTYRGQPFGQDILLYSLISTSLPSVEGNSGSPLGYGPTFFGVLSMGGPQSSIFSRSLNIYNYTHVNAYFGWGK